MKGVSNKLVEEIGSSGGEVREVLGLTGWLGFGGRTEVFWVRGGLNESRFVLTVGEVWAAIR